MQTEHVKICPVCKGTDLENFLTARDFTCNNESFQIQKCIGCGLLLTNPRPVQENIGKYYQSSTYISHASKAKSLFDYIYFQARKVALSNKHELISHYKKSGKILDYGCGTGEFLNYMGSKKWAGSGIEPIEKARTKATQLTRNHSATIYENLQNLPSSRYDIITLWHVLEHVPDPAVLLSSLKGLLEKNGFIFVAVPNHESYDATHYKKYWAGYDVPRHFWHFGKKQMQRLLENNGLKLIKIVPMKMDAFYVSLLSEKYKNGGKHSPFSPIKAFLQGLTSNAKARKSMNYSSLIYIAEHA